MLIFHVETPSVPICDFCMRPNVKWTFFTEENIDYSVAEDPLAIIDDGEWAACEECHDLIVENSQDELLERFATGFFEKYPEKEIDREQVIRDAHRIQNLFFETLKGDPVRCSSGVN